MENFFKFDQKTWFEVLNKISFIDCYNAKWQILTKNETSVLEILRKSAWVHRPLKVTPLGRSKLTTPRPI